MRAFVACATGAIGRQLLPLLTSTGHEAIGLDKINPRRMSRGSPRDPDLDHLALARRRRPLTHPAGKALARPTFRPIRALPIIGNQTDSKSAGHGRCQSVAVRQA